MKQFGASFSVPYAQYLDIDPQECLAAALDDLGVRRFRLMSYWNRLEPAEGEYDFRELDWQVDMIEAAGGEVTLCLGLRQPRWPESHWPDWALDTPDEIWQPALERFIRKIIERYKGRDCIISYQLENEALNRSFGIHGNFDRERLKREYALVKQADPSRPCIMSTSNSYGIPFFGPTPDLYGFSIYRYMHQNGRYTKSWLRPGFVRLRAGLIWIIKRRKTFVHELQAEPWGPGGIPDMPLEEQFKSMNLKHVKEAIRFAEAARLYPIDIWGLEWWYYLKIQHDQSDIWDYLKTVIK